MTLASRYQQTCASLLLVPYTCITAGVVACIYFLSEWCHMTRQGLELFPLWPGPLRNICSTHAGVAQAQGMDALLLSSVPRLF